MASTKKIPVGAFAVTIAVAILTSSSFAVDPVAVWDGAASEFNFSNLTRTVGDNTYTLNTNGQNSVSALNSYILIGNDDRKAGVTITATNADPSVTNAFGYGAVSVIMKCSDMNLSDDTFRGVIGLLAGDTTGWFSPNDNNVKIALATKSDLNTGYRPGERSHIFRNGAFATNDVNRTLFSTAQQIICLTFNVARGVHIYLNGNIIASAWEGEDVFTDWLNPAGIVLGGVDKDGSSKLNAQTGMKIEAIAVFDEELTEDAVSAYKFPSDAILNVTEDTTVSEINSDGRFEGKDDIDLYIADGVTIVGDATFDATTVNFHCNGSFILTPPANNEATFNFVTGRPIIRYDRVLPTSGMNFTSNTVPEFVTDPTRWTGTIWLRNIDVVGMPFSVNPYGNESSVVRLTGVGCYLGAPEDSAFTNSVPTELSNNGSSYDDALYISNGYSVEDGHPNRCAVFKKLMGDGLLASEGSGGVKAVVVVQDASEFSGTVRMSSRIVVFGDAMPEPSRLSSGMIYITKESSVAIQAGKWWATGGIVLDGGLYSDALSKIGDSEHVTSVSISDTGVFTLAATGGDRSSFDTDYSNISGAGTLKLEGAYWFALPTNGTLSTDLSLCVARANGVVVPPGGIKVGSLSGEGMLRSDLELVQGGVPTMRDLTIVQSKDTEWGGVFSYEDRVAGVYVRPGVSSSGTLTLSGEQTQNNDLVVETNAMVNLTGTWVGPVSVDGTISGTGTINGNLTLNDGATLKLDDLSGALAVSGAFTARGAISIELPEGALSNSKRKCMLLSSTGSVDLSGATFTVTVGGEPVKMADYGFSVFRGRLMLKRNGSVYTIR